MRPFRNFVLGFIFFLPDLQFWTFQSDKARGLKRKGSVNGVSFSAFLNARFISFQAHLNRVVLQMCGKTYSEPEEHMMWTNLVD